ncbi:hypothetical protein AB0M20_00570 [Actinoplanes sp. NPDC051633]|uniref:hypothetical protein n=1 Tax=Actinoplanes sp. NPDC051633 TaxID=3155670 RepID=UPI0034437D62
MPTKHWIPLTGELVLRSLDENSGQTFRGLEATLGLHIGPGPMALIGALLDLADAGLAAVDGMDSRATFKAVRRDMYEYMEDSAAVWRTTTGWMKITKALSEVRLGSRRDGDTKPFLCYPVYGQPGKYLDQTDIFVVMPFADDLKAVYEDHLVKVAVEENLSIKRGDDFYTGGAIMSDVWSAICASSLVIADCTGRNANVFYELGIAHTVGVPVMMISRSSNDVPSDLRHLRHYVYEFTPRGMEKLELAVRRVIANTLINR